VQIYAGKIYDTQLVHPLNTTTNKQTVTPYKLAANKLNANPPSPDSIPGQTPNPRDGHCRVPKSKQKKKRHGKLLRKIGFTLI